MCRKCDAWVAARHDPNWKPPRGKTVGVVRRPRKPSIKKVSQKG